MVVLFEPVYLSEQELTYELGLRKIDDPLQPRPRTAVLREAMLQEARSGITVDAGVLEPLQVELELRVIMNTVSNFEVSRPINSDEVIHRLQHLALRLSRIKPLSDAQQQTAGSLAVRIDRIMESCDPILRRRARSWESYATEPSFNTDQSQDPGEDEFAAELPPRSLQLSSGTVHPPPIPPRKPKFLYYTNGSAVYSSDQYFGHSQGAIPKQPTLNHESLLPPPTSSQRKVTLSTQLLNDSLYLGYRPSLPTVPNVPVTTTACTAMSSTFRTTVAPTPMEAYRGEFNITNPFRYDVNHEIPFSNGRNEMGHSEPNSHYCSAQPNAMPESRTSEIPRYEQRNTQPTRNSNMGQTNYPNFGMNSTRQGGFSKPVPPNLWRISFSGEEGVNKYDLTVHEFLKQIRLYQRTNGFSDEQLLDSMVYLLGGRAKTWFFNTLDRIQSYDEFVAELKAEFLSPGHDFTVLSELENCRQQESQTVSAFLDAIENKFNSLLQPLSETHKVYFAGKNLQKQYAYAVLASKPKTMRDLRNLVKQMEHIDPPRFVKKKTEPVKTNNSANFRMFGRHRINLVDTETAQSLLEKLELDSDLSDSEAENEIFFVRRERSKDSNGSKSKTHENSTGGIKSLRRCARCKRTDHSLKDCSYPAEPDVCFKCGKQGVRVTNCPNCSGNTNGALALEESRAPANSQ